MMTDLSEEERPIGLTLIENGWLTGAVWERARDGDPIARRLFRKLKAHAIAAGVDWYYGEPWQDDTAVLETEADPVHAPAKERE